MALASASINSFAGGEIAPDLLGRADLDWYYISCQTCLNMVVRPQGGAWKRGGTRFIAEVKDSSRRTALIPFEFSTLQAYTLEVGNTYFRVYRNKGRVESGGVPVDVTTPYTEAQLFDGDGKLLLQRAQSADKLFVVNANHPPQEITRSAHTSWTIGATTFTNYPFTESQPQAIALFKQRLWLAGANEAPNKLVASKVGNFTDFTVTDPVKDDERIEITLDADQVNAILWLSAGKNLFCGTLAGEWHLLGDAGRFTPVSIEGERETTEGSARMQAVQVSNATLFVQRFAKRLIEIAYAFSDDAFIPNDVSIRAHHLLESGIVSMAWAQRPHRTLWLANGNGQLIGFTFNRLQSLTAWHQHEIGGGGLVESVATIPGPDRDEVWLVVRRTIGGQTKRYVELLEPPLEEDAGVWDSFYLDSGLTFDGAIAQTLTVPSQATAEGATGVVFTAGGAAFSGGDVGREILLRKLERQYETGVGWKTVEIDARAEITGFTSATVVTCKIILPFPAAETLAAGGWRLSATTISGLDHLEGETVQVLADGATVADKVVSGGTITLDSPAGVVHVGYGYPALLSPMPLAVQNGSDAKTKRVLSAAARLYRTSGGEAGANLAKMQPLQLRESQDRMDTASPLRSGIQDIPLDGALRKEARVFLRQREPLPMNVLALTPVFDSEG